MRQEKKLRVFLKGRERHMFRVKNPWENLSENEPEKVGLFLKL